MMMILLNFGNNSNGSTNILLLNIYSPKIMSRVRTNFDSDGSYPVNILTTCVGKTYRTDTGGCHCSCGNVSQVDEVIHGTVQTVLCCWISVSMH